VTPPAQCNNAGKYPAENCTQYYECVPFLWWFNLELKTCSSGQAFNSTGLACVTDSRCDASTGEFITEAPITTPITTTTAPVTPPAECNNASKYSAQNCSQYYECVPFLWWFNLELKSCSSGEAFNSTELTCVTDSRCDAVRGEFITEAPTTTTISTTTVQVTSPAECNNASKYPAQNCSQYYECVPFLWWFNLELKSCSLGEAFNSTELACVTNRRCDAETGEFVPIVPTTVTTTTSVTTTPISTTTTVPVTSPAQCTSASKNPAQNCSQYYECVPFLWWFNLELKSCPSGQVFNSTELTCNTNSRCDADTEEFITVASTTQSTTVLTTPTSIRTTATTPVHTVTPPAQCNNASKYPAQNCNKYYECVPHLWWFNLELKSCSSGEAFSTSKLECITDSICAAVTGEPVTGESITTVSSTTEVTKTEPLTSDSTTVTTASTTNISISTTTIAPVSPPAECNTASKFPAENCNQYYQCVPFLWWFNLELKSCSSGEAFSITPPSCTAIGKYVSRNCNQYYECIAVMWWYELVVQTCPPGQFYNNSTQTCAANSTC
ncbi:hypothetical protein NQ314_013597, partial [Rhamnusium bicolor]